MSDGAGSANAYAAGSAKSPIGASERWPAFQAGASSITGARHAWAVLFLSSSRTLMPASHLCHQSPGLTRGCQPLMLPSRLRRSPGLTCGWQEQQRLRQQGLHWHWRTYKGQQYHCRRQTSHSLHLTREGPQRLLRGWTPRFSGWHCSRCLNVHQCRQRGRPGQFPSSPHRRPNAEAERDEEWQ